MRTDTRTWRLARVGRKELHSSCTLPFLVATQSWNMYPYHSATNVLSSLHSFTRIYICFLSFSRCKNMESPWVHDFVFTEILHRCRTKTIESGPSRFILRLERPRITLLQVQHFQAFLETQRGSRPPSDPLGGPLTPCAIRQKLICTRSPRF